jgi:hypothetical protein
VTDRPSLAELRARVHKERHREIGNWLARRWGRPAAVYGTWLAVRLRLTAHQVTALALGMNLAGAAAFATGSLAGFVAGVLALHLAFWLDHVDGQVARWRGTSSLGGVYFDYLMHHIAASSLGFGLGFGLSMRGGSPLWSATGFLAGAGWLFLGLHNDCRYKSFFQRLKRETRTYRVDGGAGGRPAPPDRWPRRGRAALTWPLFKACEPHVVLLTLSAIALAGLTHEPLLAPSWRAYVACMAVLAPLLATARAARAVRRDGPGTEFDRWFRPWDAA